MIPINYGIIYSDSIAHSQRQTQDFRQQFAEAIHFLQPGNNLVRSRNALGRQLIRKVLRVLLELKRTSSAVPTRKASQPAGVGTVLSPRL